VPEGEGAVATRGGEVVAYPIAAVGDERAEVGMAGVAASEPEAVRDVYASLARSWPSWHQAVVRRPRRSSSTRSSGSRTASSTSTPSAIPSVRRRCRSAARSGRELEGRPCGHAVLYRRPTGDLRIPEDNIDLSHAATFDDVRGSGVGLALTAQILRWAHEQGFRSTTDWRSVNLLASRFWSRRGWRPTHYRLYRAIP
jgi:predicted GNAT family acetyltransferase